MLENIAAGFMNLLSWEMFLYINLGVLIGIIFGAIPGLSGNLGIIIFLPFTFTMDAATAIIFLMCIYCGSEYGGSVASILLGTPGTNEAAATLIDGYPLAQQGHARKALMTALIASFTGGVISALSLLLFAPTLAKVTISFGPPEYFALAVFGLSIIAGVSGKSLKKGLISGCLGMLLAMVGMDSISGTTRFAFGSVNLMRGLNLMALITGVFAVPNILNKVRSWKSHRGAEAEAIVVEDKGFLSRKELKTIAPTIGRSSLIGVLIGAIPGTGTAVAAFMSYNVAKRLSKHPEKFGNGALEGVAAPESANNAVTAAALIPLLTLGIPGSPAAAALIGAFVLQGMQPGPTLFRTQGVIMYTIMVGILVCNFFMLLQGSMLSKVLAKVAKVSNALLIPLLALVCLMGSFSIYNSMFEMGVFLVFGFVGYLISKFDFPLVPIVLGFVLGPIAEFNFRRGLAMSGGSLTIFLQRPISVIFLLIALAIIVFTAYSQAKAGQSVDKEEETV